MKKSIILVTLLMIIDCPLIAMKVPQVSDKKKRVGQPPSRVAIPENNHTTQSDKKARLSVDIYCYFSMQQSLQASPTSKR